MFEKAVFVRCAQFLVMSAKLIGFERVLPIRCAPYSKLEYTNHLRFQLLQTNLHDDAGDVAFGFNAR